MQSSWDALLGGNTALAFCDDGPFLKKHRRLVAFRPIHREELLLVCSRAFERTFVAGKHSLRHLRTLPHVEYVRDRSVLSMWYRHHFATVPTALTLRLVADNVHAVLAGIRAGLGLGVVPEHLVRQELARGSLIKIRSRARALAHQIVLAQRKDRVPTFAERLLIEAVRDQLRATKTCSSTQGLMLD